MTTLEEAYLHTLSIGETQFKHDDVWYRTEDAGRMLRQDTHTPVTEQKGVEVTSR